MTAAPLPPDTSGPPALRNVDAAGFWPTLVAVVRGAQLDCTRGSLSRATWLLAVPMVLEMAMESTFAVVDMLFVARLGEQAIASVGLTESMLAIVYAIGLGIAMSTNAMVARRVGEGDLAGAARAGAQAVGLVAAIGVLLGVPCALSGPTLLLCMGAAPETAELGGGYASIVLGSQVVVLLLFVQNAIFRGAGDPMLAMKALWIANLCNCALDPLLIFGWGPIPAMGVTGAGLATLIGRSIGVLYQVHALFRGRGRIDLRRATWFDARAMLTLLRLSAFGIGQFLIATASWAVLTRIAAAFGDVAVAGYTVGIRILVFTYLPAWGLSNAVATLVGQNLGAGNPARAERATWLVMGYNVAFMTAVGAVMLALPEPIVGLFTEKAAVASVAADCLRVFSYGYPMYAVGMVLVQALNGAGDTATPTWINAVAYWVLEIPIALGLAYSWEMRESGVFWSVVIAESAMAVIALVVFRRGSWKRKKV